MKARTLLLGCLASLSLATGCPTSDPPAVHCPTTAGNPVDLCSMVGEDVVVEGAVEAWGQTPRVLNLTGFGDTVVTPGAIDIHQVVRGGVSTTARLDVLFVGCIGSNGESIQGPLETSAGKSEGYFFIRDEGDYFVVVPQGFFRLENGLLTNPGIASGGITESELFNRVGTCAGYRVCGDAGTQICGDGGLTGP